MYKDYSCFAGIGSSFFLASIISLSRLYYSTIMAFSIQSSFLYVDMSPRSVSQIIRFYSFCLKAANLLVFSQLVAYLLFLIFVNLLQFILVYLITYTSHLAILNRITPAIKRIVTRPTYNLQLAGKFHPTLIAVQYPTMRIISSLTISSLFCDFDSNGKTESR